MKNSILIISAVFTSLSLMAFGLLNAQTPNSETVAPEKTEINTINTRAAVTFFYDIDSRFMSTVT